MSRKIWIMPLFFALILFMLFVAEGFCIPAPTLEISELTDLSSKPMALSSPKEKQLVVFWATWCDDCRSKLRKELVAFNERKDVAVTTINLDKDPERAKEFISKEGITLPVLRDPEKKFKKALSIFSVPHWALLKRVKENQFEIVASESAFDLEHVKKALGEAPGK